MTTLRTLTLALLLTTTRAAAGPCDEVASTVRQTNELRRRGAHDEAVTRLNALYRTCHAPRVLAQIGLAEHGRGRWLDAWRALHDALRHRDDPWIAAHAAVLVGAVTAVRAHLADVSPRCSVAGAQLTVDGRAVGSLPLASPLVVAAGRHVLRLTAPEHEASEVVVVLAEGARYRGFVIMLAASPYGETR